MRKRKGRKKASKWAIYACTMTILFSNMSLAMPVTKISAVELETNTDTAPDTIEQPAVTAEPNQAGQEVATELSDQTGQAVMTEEPVPTNSEQVSSGMDTNVPADTGAQSTQTTEQVTISATQETVPVQSVVAEEDFNQYPPLLITELSPDSKGTDNYEFFELYNNTNQPISLSNYSFVYRYTLTGEEKPFQVQPVAIDPQETLVFWFNNAGKTLADFNNQHGVQLSSEQVVEFKDVFPGFANGGDRAIGLKDSQSNDVIFAGYLPNETNNSGMVVQYKYPSNGTEMDKLQVLANATPGSIETAQVPAKPVTINPPETDTVAPVIIHQAITESLAFEPIKVEATITDDKATPTAILFYKEEGVESYSTVTMSVNVEQPQTYTAEIPGADVKGNLSYYIEATDGVNRQKTAEHSISVHIPEETYSDIPLLITELAPNSKGTGTDYYEYIELYNNTNKPLSLSNYSFIYRYTDGSQADKVFQVPTATLDPQETKVLWFNNGNRTLADFNANFGSALTSNQIVEFKDVFPGFANGGNRAIVIKTVEGTEMVSASYLGDENDNNGAVIEYKFPSSGMEMEKYKVKRTPTVGTVEALQVPSKPINLEETPKDVESPVITHTNVSESESYSPITIKAIVTDNMAVPFATLYYKKIGEETFTSLSMNPDELDAGSYTAEIPGGFVESDLIYYIEATDGINAAKTEEFTIKVNEPEVDFNQIPQFLVTEVVPDSTNVGSADGYEFIEVYNNTDKEMNFKDYKIHYRYGEDPATDVIWPSIPDDVVIPAKKTLVFWIINGQNDSKTVADFNANYGTNLVENKDIVRIYSAGMANGSMRGLVVATNAKKEISVSYYFDEANVDDTNVNKGIIYKYPVDGSTRSIKVSPGLTNATPGAVEFDQVPVKSVHIATDTEAPTVENRTEVTEINQKENIRIVADAKDNQEVKSVRLFYRTSVETTFNEALLAENYDDLMYHHTIYSPEFIGKNYVEYYFVVSDGTNEVTSETYKIKMTSDLDDASLRVNVKDGDLVKGEKILKGTSKTDSTDQVKLFVDGKEMTENTYKSIENTAYFAFVVNGVNTFFQNGVTMGDEILRIFDDGINDWDTITVPIDADRLKLGENIITVRAGNKASPFQLEESEENRDDYNIRNARLVLSDGTVLIDPTHNDPAKVYDMGDDGTYRPFEDFTFTINEEFTHSKTYQWDTTTVADGEHSIKVQDTDEEVSRTILVDNTAPVISTSLVEGKEYKGPFTIDVDVTDEIAGVDMKQILLDSTEIDLPYQTSSSKLAPGAHKLTVLATDKVGNQSELAVTFTVVNENPFTPELISPTNRSATPVEGDPNLKVKVTDPTNDEVKVSFYKGFTYDTSKTNEVKAFKNATDMEPPQTMVSDGEEAFSAEDISLTSKKDQQYLTLDSDEQFPYQRFDVSVDPSVDDNDLVELVWNGKSLEGRKVSMYAWNHQQGKWVLITYQVAGTADFELKGNVAVGEYVKDSKINVIVQDEIPQTPDEYDYTFVWMSDTQYYSESYPYIFERQTNWIAENKEKLKIKYVFHTGDVVDEADKEYQWNHADEYMKVLESNNIPYGILAGNHDVDHKTSDYTQFTKWFGEDRYKNQPFYGGSYQNNRGHYDLISSNGNDFIMLYMGWGVQDQDLQWMNDILKQYPDRKAILSFHEYLLVSGNRSPLGDKIYNEVVLPNENVVAVLSGHYHDSETLIDSIDDNGDGSPDRSVYQLLGDYQGGPEGGQGYLKLLHFDQDNNRIIVNTYSPYLDDYNFYDPETYPGKDEMVINLDLSVDKKQVATDYFAVNIYTDSKIGEQENVTSGTVAETVWKGLTENQTYSWYAVAEDEYTGNAVSEIWSFTKGKNQQPTVPSPSDGGSTPLPSDGSDAPKPTDGASSPNLGEPVTSPVWTSNNLTNTSTASQLTTNNSSNKVEKISGNLPNTATHSYNLLFLGAIILMIGLSVWVVNRRLLMKKGI